MSEDLDDWNPMSDDFQSIVFNSYSNGQTAAHLTHNLVPDFGSEFCETRRPPKLYIDGFPSDLTETGLKNFLKRIGCTALSVKILNSKNRLGLRFSFVDFESTKEAQRAVELLRNQSLYKLSVNFATTQNDRQKREVVVEREKSKFQRLISAQIEMKQKIDLGNCTAINATNGDSPLSPIQSEAGSNDSSHLDLLSPLAKSNKLVKILEGPDDDCSYCTPNEPMEHLHFILSQQKIVDPTKIPELIDVINVCQSCESKGSNMKLCSQCKGATYCNRNCQSAHWPRHRIHCKPDANESLNLNSTQNSINGNASHEEKVPQIIKPIPQPSEKVVPIATTQRATKTTPQIVNTVRGSPKESTPLVADPRQSAVDSEFSANTVSLMKTAIKESSLNKEFEKLKITPTPTMSVDNEVLTDGVEVSVCFGRNPLDFYVQKSIADADMETLSEEINKKVDEFPKLSNEDLKIGTLCGGVYAVDGNCYRARIVSKVNDNTYSLYFIDYGNTESVETKDIKRLPQIFFDLKAQAIRCSLHSIVPQKKEWSRDAIIMFGEMGETNHFSKVKIAEKTDQQIYKIDLFNEKGESIRQKLAEKGFATLTDELSETVSRNSVETPISSKDKSLPQTPSKSESPVIVQGSPKVIFNKSSIDEISNNYVKPVPMPVLSEKSKSKVVLKSRIDLFESNDEISLMVTNVLNSEDFQYFGILYIEEVQDLLLGLTKDYPAVKWVVPEVGDMVVAQASDNDCYRSYVLSVGNKSAKVFMIDSGFVETVVFEKIFKLKKKYHTIPAYGMLLLPNTPSAARLIELSQTDESMIEGVLVKQNNKSFFKINKDMIEIKNYMTAVPLIMAADEEEAEKEAENPIGDAFNKLPLRQFSVGQHVEALGLYQDTDDLKTFYVSGDDDDCAKLYGLCAEFGKTFNDNITVNPLPAKVYLIRSKGDKEWYRAVVNEVTPNGIRIKYIDFGNEEEVDPKYVMELSHEIQMTTIKPLAVKCKVESTDMTDKELITKIEKAVEGAFLLKLDVLKIEDGIHWVKVK